MKVLGTIIAIILGIAIGFGLSGLIFWGIGAFIIWAFGIAFLDLLARTSSSIYCMDIRFNI